MRAWHRVWFTHHGFKPDWKNKREVIHHIDGNRKNNSIENLQLMTQTEHIKLHGTSFTGRKHSEETKRKYSEHRKQIREHIRRKALEQWQNPEIRERIIKRRRAF